MPQKLRYGIVRRIKMKRSLFSQIIRILFFILVAGGALAYAAKDKYALRDLTTHLKVFDPLLKQTPLGAVLNSQSETISQNVPIAAPETSIQSLYNFIDAERHKNNLPTLKNDPKIDTIAKRIAEGSAALGDSFTELDTKAIISELAEKYHITGYSFSHDTLMGVQTTDVVITQWITHPESVRYLDEKIETIAIATASALIKGVPTGVVTTVFTRKVNSVPTATTDVPIKKAPTEIVFPNISNESVLSALNSYRQVHGAPPLKEHPNLCGYAEKRLSDLLAFGGLDNHEGFKKDFENPEKIPQIIKEYPGSNIGENLAYQFCRNMKTNEAFIAPHATALIEWCFDSSTKGHREAQLSTAYISACSRNKNGYFVIIFGD